MLIFLSHTFLFSHFISIELDLILFVVLAITFELNNFVSLILFQTLSRV